MSLQTRRPPGHAKRKALNYTADILSLRGQGHTFSAIREALEDAGIVVSISTVRREAMRAPSGTAALALAAAPAKPPASAPDRRINRPRVTAIAKATSAVPSATSLPGKSIAEDFVRGRSTNSLYLKESST